MCMSFLIHAEVCEFKPKLTQRLYEKLPYLSWQPSGKKIFNVKKPSNFINRELVEFYIKLVTSVGK